MVIPYHVLDTGCVHPSGISGHLLASMEQPQGTCVALGGPKNEPRASCGHRSLSRQGFKAHQEMGMYLLL